jgi:hypothetical protein
MKVSGLGLLAREVQKAMPALICDKTVVCRAVLQFSV